MTLLVSVMVSIGLTLAAGEIAAYYDKPIADAVRIMAWSAPFLTVAWVFLVAIRALRLMQFEVYVMAVAGPLILLAGALPVALAGFGLTELAWVQLGVSAACCLLAGWFFRRFYSLGESLFPTAGGRNWRGRLRRSGKNRTSLRMLFRPCSQISRRNCPRRFGLKFSGTSTP